MILISSNSHKLRFSENERAQMVSVHFIKTRPGIAFP